MSDNSIVREIKDKLDIVQVFERYGYSLKKEGSEHKGSISATSKSGKSLHVNPDKQVYNDFAGHAGGGDVLDAISYCEGLDIRSDFPQVLKIAADMAGIELHNNSIDYDIAAEKRELQLLYRIVFEHYHSCLSDKDREYIRGKWGLLDKIIDELLIGIAADNSHLLQVPEIKDYFSNELLKKSGLFYCNDDSKLVDIYRGRIVFPYWKNGEIVYSIGRSLKSDNDSSQKKFIKQLIKSEKRNYVSEAVKNVLFGEDTIRGQDMVYITEGIADAITLMQAGLPVLSPVTVRFKDSDIEQLVSSCKGKKLVKIINDNETNNSGLNGAIDTAKALEAEGIRATVIQLPKEEGQDKIDIAEYMLTHSREDLEGLKGKKVYDIILDQIAPADSIPEDIIEKLDLFKSVVSELQFMPETARKAFIFETVKDRLKIKKVSDAKTAYKEVVGGQPVEYPSFEVTFMRNNGQVRTKKLGNHVMSLNNYITMKDNKDIYYYKDGVYVRGGEDVIKKDVQDILGDYSSEQRQKEIVNYIRINTLIERDEIGHDCTRINLRNGIYNLETEELEPHRPDYISINQIPINYDPGATCVKIDKYMSEVLKPEDIPTILEFFGYCLIPDVSMQKSLLVHGPGQGGKSVLLTMLNCAIGGTNCSRESLHKLENDKYSVAELYGKLVNIFPDLASATIYENEMFKQISGNDRKLRGERKFGHPFQFINTSRLVFSANDLPPVPNGNFAYFRRWILIKMDVVIDENKQDKHLDDKLTTDEELSGLLNKMISALSTLLRNGKFSYNKSVSDVEEEYLIHSDPIAAFVKSKLTYSDDYVLKRDVLAAYVDWCKDHNKNPVYEGQLAKKMRTLGYIPGRLSESQGHLGIWRNCTLKNMKNVEEGTTTTQEQDETSTGSGKQPCTDFPVPDEPEYKDTRLDTPIVADVNKKNISYQAVEKKNKANICTIGGCNLVTLYDAPDDSEKTVQGCKSEPCTDTLNIIENLLDKWEAHHGRIFAGNKVRVPFDIREYPDANGIDPKLIFEAVEKRAMGRCLDCGSEEIHHVETGKGYRCNACHKVYSNPPAVKIPEEISLEPARVTP